MNRPTGIEKRNFEVRADSQGDEMAISGYAASFNVLSQDLGGFREMCAMGCFSRSLSSGSDVKALVNHDASLILGRRANGTLTISEDERGLKFRCVLDPNNSQHRDAYASVKRGDWSECSFAFTVPQGGDDWSEETDAAGNKYVKRVLRDVNLLDCSIVTYPAYNAPGSTEVNARNQQNAAEWEALRAKVAAMPGDWQRQERANEIGLQIAAETGQPEARGMWDWVSARLKRALRDMGLDYFSHDDENVYGADPDDDEDSDRCYRFQYEIGPNGETLVDEDSRTLMKASDVSSVRAQEVKTDRALQARMRAQAGIYSR